VKRTLFDHDHEGFRESYRRFLQKEVMPERAKWWQQGIVPREISLKLGAQGCLFMWADEELGGLGVEDFRYRAHATSYLSAERLENGLRSFRTPASSWRHCTRNWSWRRPTWIDASRCMRWAS
jgi:alkylation response protein AidB-like acyl-CoA dehydrogenase